MKRFSCTSLLIFLLTGCAGELLKPVPLDAANRQRVEAAGDITVTMQQTPGFLFNTPSTALVGAGMARWKDPGNAPSWVNVTRTHGVPDFTDTLREALLNGLTVTAPSVSFSTSEGRQPYSTKLETAYVRQYPTDYVLEVRSQYGSFSYGPMSWKTYFLNYSGQARLIRTADEVVVWKATCSVPAKEHAELQVPAEDFLAGDGELLRKAAEFSTGNCADQLLAAYTAR